MLSALKHKGQGVTQGTKPRVSPLTNPPPQTEVELLRKEIAELRHDLQEFMTVSVEDITQATDISTIEDEIALLNETVSSILDYEASTHVPSELKDYVREITTPPGTEKLAVHEMGEQVELVRGQWCIASQISVRNVDEFLEVEGSGAIGGISNCANCPAGQGQLNLMSDFYTLYGMRSVYHTFFEQCD